MKTSTQVFLVLLRLVIGWHFLFEGISKLDADNWSSEAYLRESVGPLAPAFRWMAGDPLVERLTPKPIPEGADMGQVNLVEYFPPALERDWQAYFDAFVKNYNLDEKQRQQAEGVLEQQKAQFMAWLVTGKERTVSTPSPHGPPIPAEKTVAERLADYRRKNDEARRLIEVDLPKASRTDPVFASEVNSKIKAVKQEASGIRSQLRADLDKQNKRMHDELYEKLHESLTTDQRKAPAVVAAMVHPDWRSWTLLDWTDFVVAWGLTVVGAMLILGLFTRPACVVGAVLLLSFYLAMPALPWVPDNPRSEGHYFFVNKNIIEMIALFGLATVPTGRWLGIDGVLQFLMPRRKAKPSPAPTTPPPAPAEPATKVNEPAVPTSPQSA